jgi:signal transduction histidine kinase
MPPIEVLVDPALRVDGDAALLRIVMDNLLSNARKFVASAAHPRIAVLGGREGGFVRVDVSDNGVGFDRAQAGRLFEPFVRLHDSAEYEGTGIGLALCRRIVERLGGKIRASGECGRGATFTILLPPPTGSRSPPCRSAAERAATRAAEPV